MRAISGVGVGGPAVRCQPAALSAAGEMSDSDLKMERPGGKSLSTIYSNMEFRFSVQKLALLTKPTNIKHDHLLEL